MPDETYSDENENEVYEDYEEYVDFDEHERARADERRAKEREERERVHPEDVHDEYHYGEESGEAFEKGDLE